MPPKLKTNKQYLSKYVAIGEGYKESIPLDLYLFNNVNI